MTKEELFRATLEKMANEGNVEAKFALSLAANIAPTHSVANNNHRAIDELKNANAALLRALGYNDTKWTKDTDRSINTAQTSIINAISLIK